MKCKYYRFVSAHGGSRVSWSRTRRQSMNVGWADFHLVIYKLSGYVLNNHWSDGALFHWEWPVAMLFQLDEPTSSRFIELQCVWLADMFLRADLVDFSLTWFDNVAGTDELCGMTFQSTSSVLCRHWMDGRMSRLYFRTFPWFLEGHCLGQLQLSRRLWRVSKHCNTFIAAIRSNFKVGRTHLH